MTMTPRARVIQVIEVRFVRGEGVTGDPVRQVIVYYDLQGAMLAEYDPQQPFEIDIDRFNDAIGAAE